MSEKDLIKADKVIDTVGLFCPAPLFETRSAVDSIEIGEVLEVIADDPAAEEDIKRFVKRTGHELLEFEKDDDILRFMIKRIK